MKDKYINLASTEDNSSEMKNEKEQEISDLTLDFVTSSAISRVNIKFLAVYIPILWFSGILVGIYWYSYLNNPDDWFWQMIFFPINIFASYFIFIFGCAFFSKLFLILINLIHMPKEGIFRAEKGDKDFEFWCLRTELKKLIIWLMNNCPLPWIDTWAFRWFGIKIDFTSHFYDAWVDIDFIRFGRKVTIGQGAVVMSSMVVGKYLIIKKVTFDDYTIIGGVSAISPGTFIGRDTTLGALSCTNFNQVLEPGWIYFGIPGIKLKPNKYAESRRDIIIRKNVDDGTKYKVQHDVIIDEDKKHLL
jgi:carbonic anhydrase/acetyltransferase-like protein (isoleucine patch superfamily)